MKKLHVLELIRYIKAIGYGTTMGIKDDFLELVNVYFKE